MDSLLSDLRLAVRLFGRQPGTTTLVIITLALGIAANTTAFGLINGLFLRPFPFPDPDRLVFLNETAPRWNLEFASIHYPDFHHWRENTSAFEAMALYDETSVNVSDETRSERLTGARVTRDFPAVLRVRPLLGRTFTADEDRPGGPPVVAIGHALWMNRFAGATDVLGRTLRINGVPHSIVGVLPPEAAFPTGAQFWVPLAGNPLQECCGYTFDGIARLRQGVIISAAREDLFRAHRAIWESRGDTARVVSPLVMPLRERLVADYRVMLRALGAGVALVLLVACANVASVMLARALFRRRETAVRMALGASARRLGRQLLTESLALSVVAGILGLAIGQWALRALLAAAPERLPPWANFDPDARTVVFAVAVVIGTAFLFGLAPVLQARQTNLRGVLASGARTSPSKGQHRALQGLVVVDLALAAVLLAGGGLLLRAYRHVRAVDPGFSGENVLTFRISPPRSAYPNGQAALGFYERLLEQVRSLPGVVTAAAITCPPLGCNSQSFFEAEGQPRYEGVILTRLATPEYFATLGIALRHGRPFTADDGTEHGRRAIIVDEAFARHFWPDVNDPTGRRVRFAGDTSAGAWLTVVGVTNHVKHSGLDRPSHPGIYLPAARIWRDGFPTSFTVAVLAVTDPRVLVQPIQAIVRRMDPELPLYQVRTLAEAVDRSLAVRRMFAWVLAVLAGIAVTLAVGGIYGVLSYIVGRRAQEMGIRMALGAQRAEVVALVVRQGSILVSAGLLVGLPAALGASRSLADLLVGVSAADPSTFTAVAVLLTSTGVLATLIPAWRASRVDPRTALIDDR